MRDRPGPECFICCKQVKRIEWLSFWDSWGACLPSTTTLGPEKRGPPRSRGGDEWTCAAAGQTEWPQVLPMVANSVVPGGTPHMYTNTNTHSHTHTHTGAHVDGPNPSTSPSHRVIFTQALSPLIGADEGLIGSFFYSTQYLSDGKPREAAWVELMRGFAQIKDLVRARFTEWEKKESWGYPLCPRHLSLMCRYLKRRGSGGGHTCGHPETLSTYLCA